MAMSGRQYKPIRNDADQMGKMKTKMEPYRGNGNGKTRTEHLPTYLEVVVCFFLSSLPL
jgi:hypothetical protein